MNADEIANLVGELDDDGTGLVELDELAGWWIEGDGAKKSRSLAGGLLQARAMLKNSNHKMLKLRGARIRHRARHRGQTPGRLCRNQPTRPPRAGAAAGLFAHLST